ncbi:MAG TPA: hypothetical protein VHM26_05485 [Chitinophagaceae bacterium]|jgi:hypothetical protein|nr:hypothetical protein [Chitinophagaceae bacterium]
MMPPGLTWSTSRLLLFRFFVVWVVLLTITIPFHYHFLPSTGNWITGVSEWMVRYSARIFVGTAHYEQQLLSDSTGFYVHMFNMLMLALVASFAWTFFYPRIRTHRQLQYWFTVYVRYFLALLLLIYGFPKVFKAQFYLPEPNILYTPMGQLYPDILYWSSMGVSRSYSMFLGCAEVIAALLLFFRRTAMMGAIGALFILLNVLAINLAYDIAVKMLTTFLIILCIYLLLTEARRIILFTSGNAVTASALWKPLWTGKTKLIIGSIKIIVILALIYESVFPYVKSNNFNDDKAPRPYLHGAWSVKTFITGNDTLPPLLTDNTRWRRVFFHRQGYFIVQKMDDSMLDYKMKMDRVNKRIQITTDTGFDTLLFDHPNEHSLLIQTMHPPVIKVVLEKIDWEKLPALQKEFSWTLDR